MSADFNGQYYDPALDDERLKKQIGRVFDLMQDGKWRTLREIESVTGDPQASISAQLRHLRKPKHGSYTVNLRKRGRREDGLWEMKLII